MKRKLSGSVTGAAILFITSGTLATTLGVRQYERITTEPAWVVSTAVKAGQVITTDLLMQTRIDRDDAATAIQDPQRILGQQLSVNKKSGDTIEPRDLTIQAKKSLSELIPAGRVLYTLSPKMGGIPYTELHGGDSLDVLVRGRNGVRTVALDVRLMGIQQKPGATNKSGGKAAALTLLQNKAKVEVNQAHGATLVVAVRPSDVYPLASVGSKEFTSVVLHSAHDRLNGTLARLTPESRFHEVEMVSGLNRSTVRIMR